MSKSSINFQKVSTHCFFHNDRNEKKRAKTVHSEFTHLNSFDINSNEALNTFYYLYDSTCERSNAKRKADKKNCLWEAVVNIEENTTMEELKRVQEYIEKEFKFTGLQIAIHRDEGHYKKDDEKFYTNHHAHLTFFTLDTSNAKQQFRRELVTPKKLRNLQTEVAKILNMERGEDARLTNKKGLKHKAYKNLKQNEEKIINSEIAKVKDLNEQINLLKNELKNNSAKREDYAKMEQLKKDLHAQLKNKELTIYELQLELENFKQKVLNISNNSQKIINEKDTEIEHYKKQLEDKQNEINILKAKNDNLEISYQQKIFLKHYEKETNINLEKFFIDIKKEVVTIKSKQKEIEIKDFGNKITASKTGILEEKVKLMLEVAQAKNWDLSKLNINGDEKFKNEVNKQIFELLKKENEQLNKVVYYNYDKKITWKDTSEYAKREFIELKKKLEQLENRKDSDWKIAYNELFDEYKLLESISNPKNIEELNRFKEQLRELQKEKELYKNLYEQQKETNQNNQTYSQTNINAHRTI